jgi:hypothetical protein
LFFYLFFIFQFYRIRISAFVFIFFSKTLISFNLIRSACTATVASETPGPPAALSQPPPRRLLLPRLASVTAAAAERAIRLLAVVFRGAVAVAVAVAVGEEGGSSMWWRG